MKLSREEVALFYELRSAVHYFVKCKLRICPEIKSIDDCLTCDDEVTFALCDAFYENMELIDSFVQENPQNLSAEKLAIVSSWKEYISGNFYIERFLKKYAVFIQNDNVYGVVGLEQGFDELIHRSWLPLYVKTVLLPFKGKIIYDGIMGHHNVYFGGGIKHRLKETYMRAKQNNRIVESLGVQSTKAPEKNARPSKGRRAELDKLADSARKLRASVDDPAIYSPAFSLVRASVEVAKAAVSDPDDLAGLLDALKKATRALKKANTVVRRME